jgi:putative phage-type endonuclease
MALTREQLEMRQSMIAATDAVILAGVYPGKKGPSSVYLSKTAALEERDEEEALAMRLGNILEPLAIDLVAEERGLTHAPGETVRHATESWIGATPDAFAVEPSAKTLTGKGAPVRRVAVIEAKAVGRFRLSHWGDELDAIPDYVHVQVQWQLLATGLKTAYVSALLGLEHRSFVIEHDDSLASALVEVCEAFWKNHVLTGTPPAPDGSEDAWKVVKKAFPRPTKGGLLWAPGPIAELAQDAMKAQAMKKHWETVEQRKKQELCALIGESEGYEGEGWRAKWSVRAAHSRPACEVAESRSLDLREVKTSKKGRAA